MKLKCKIDHISLPVGSTHRLLVMDEVIELSNEVGYPILAKYAYAFEVEDGSTQKIINRAERTKGGVPLFEGETK